MTTLSAEQAIETFQCAAEENQMDSHRVQQVTYLPEEGEVIMTGDLHDHRRNFDKLVKAADLSQNPQRHLILHELIHGDHYDEKGAEDSWRTLYRAAELKCDFPDQVHFMLANHDLAQVHGEGIMKAGVSVCEAFYAALKRDFPVGYQKVNVAIIEFLLSFPLAARTHTGLFFCHSLPTDAQIANFDFTVFNRPLAGPDYQRRTGPVYQLIWGRNMSPETAATFAENVEARVLITGHQPQDTGYAVNGPQHLIIASDHNQGICINLDLAENYEMDDIVSRARKFVAMP